MKFSMILVLYVISVLAVNAQVKTDQERQQETLSFVQKFHAKYFNDGKAAFEQQKNADAVKIFDNVLLVEPENGEAYYYRGRAFVNLNDYERGLRDYNSALKTSYKNPDVYLLIGKLEKVVGRNREALAAFNEYMRLKPEALSDKDMRWMRGRTALFSNQNQACIEDFSFFISQNPNDGAAYFNRAICQMEAGSRDEAKKDFATALKLNPNLKDNFYYHLSQEKKPDCKGTAQDWDSGAGVLLGREDDFRAFNQSYFGAKCFPNDPLLYRRKLEIFTKYAGDYSEDALAVYQNYLRLFGFDYYINPFKVKLMSQTKNLLLSERMDKPAIYKTAAEYVKQGNSIDLGDLYAVVEAANYALQLEPDNADALLLRARAFAVGNTMFAPLAWRDATAVLKTNPKSSLAYNVRGLVLKAEKNYPEAIAEFNKALSVNPNEDRAYANIGSIYELQKSYDSALLNFSKAIQISPENKAWLEFRGTAYLNSGKFPQAVEDYKHVLKIDDKSLAVRLKMVQALEKSGDANAANVYVYALLEKFPDDAKVKELAARYPNAVAVNATLKGTAREAETIAFRLDTNKMVEENNSLMARIDGAIDYYNKTQSKTDQIENRQQHIRTLEITEGHGEKIIENSRTIVGKANNFLTKYEKDKDVSPEIVQLAKSRIADSLNLIQLTETRIKNWSAERKQLQGIK